MSSKFIVSSLAIVGLALSLAAEHAQAANAFFDTDNTTAGDGLVTGQTYVWSTTANSFWSTSSVGNVATAAFSTANLAYFNGTSGGTATSYTIGVDNTINILAGGGINVGNVTAATVTLQNSATNPETNFFLGSAATWTVNSGSTLIDNINNANGAVNLNNQTLTLAGAGNVTFGGGGLDHGTSTVTDNLTGTLTLNASAQGSFDSTSTVNFNSGTLALANSAGLGSAVLKIAGGTLNNTSGAAMTLSSTGGININSNFTFLGTNNLTFGSGTVALGTTPTVTVTANTLTIPGNISGGFGFGNAGSGALVLTGSNTYTGTTTIGGGTLTLGSANAMPSSGTVAFANTTNTATLNLPGLNQTLANMTFGNQTTGTNTVTIAGNASSSLTVSPATLSFAPASSPTTSVLTVSMAPIGSFTYNNSSGALNVTDGAGGNTTGSTVTLAGTNNSITANSIAVSSGGGGQGYAGSVLNLGLNNTFDSNNINVGDNFSRGGGTLQYASGLASGGSLTIRNAAGTGGASIIVGKNSSFGGDSTVYSSVFDATGNNATLNAVISSLAVADAHSDGAASRQVTSNGTFKIGAGSMSVSSATIAQVEGTTPTASSDTYNATGLLSLNSGGTASITTLTVAVDSLGSLAGSPVTINGQITLNGSGGATTLDATTIQQGTVVSGETSRTAQVNWNDGTIGNIAGSSLSIGGVSMVLAGSAANHIFDITAGQTGTVNSTISGTGGIVKQDGGVLFLAGTNTFANATGTSVTVKGGTLSVGTIADSVFSNLGYSGTIALGGGDLQYTGAATVATTRAFNLTSATSSSLELTNSAAALTINSFVDLGSASNTLLTKLGPGTLALAGSTDNSGLAMQMQAGVLVLAKTSGSSAHAIGSSNTPGLTINGGTAQLAGSGGDQIYTQTNVVVNGGVFDFNGRSEGFNMLSGAGGIVTNSSAGTASTMTVGQFTTGGPFSSTYAGAIQDGSGSIGLTVVGNALALTGTNSFSGATSVTGGSLQYMGNSVTSLTSTSGVFGVSGGAVAGVQGNASLTTSGWMSLGHAASSAGSFVQSGGTVAINGFDANNANRSLLIGEFPTENSTYTLSAGLLNVPNGVTYLPWNGSGVLNISGGTANLMQLAFGSNQASGGTLNLSSGGELYLGNGGIVNTFGSAVINVSGGTLGANSSWSSTVPMTLSNSPVVDTNGNNVTLSGAISGGGSLRKVNPGALTLTASNGYAGATTINGGTLLLSGSATVNSSSAINVNAGAALVQNSSVASTPGIAVSQGTLDGTGAVGAVTVSDAASSTVQNGSGGTGTLTLNSLTFNGGATMNLLQSGGSATTSPSLNVLAALTTGAINNSGTIALNVQTATLWNNSTSYDLINFGSLGGAGSASFVPSIAGLSVRQTYTLTYNSNDLLLNIIGDSPKWTGADGTSWQVGPTGSNGNWVLVIAGTQTNYIEGDAVLFDDTAGTNGTVAISAENVSPANVTFNNNALNYTLSSSGGFGISGNGFLAKSGSGTLLIATSNGYTGGTTLTAGVLHIGNSSALGSGPLTLAGGALTSADTTSYTLANPLVIASSAALGDPVNNGPLTFSAGSGAVASNSVLTVNSPVAISGSLSGTGGLTLAGTGTLALLGSSSYSGGTTLSSNLLQIGSNTALGTGPFFISGGILTSASTANYTLPNALAISGSVTLGDAINNGTLTFSAASGTLSNSPALTVNSPVAISGALAGNGTGLTLLGPSSLTLGGSNTYSGGTNVSGGTLLIGADANLGSTAVPNLLTINGGALSFTAASVTPSANHPLVFNGSGGTVAGVQTSGVDMVAGANILQGSAPLTITGASATDSVMQVAAAQPNLSGSINITSGRIVLTSTAATLGTSNITIGAGSASLYLSAAATLGNNVYIQSNGGENRGAIRLQNGGMLNGQLILLNNASISDESSSSAVTVNGNISGPFTFTVGGMTGSNSASVYILTGSNSQAATTIGSGILNINADQALGATAGTLTFGNSTSTLQVAASGIMLSAARSVVLNGTSNFDTNNLGLTVNSAITGTGSLVKIGAGTLTLANTNAYTGSTTINAGTIVTGVNGALPMTTLAYTGGGTLNIGATSQTVAGLTVANNVTGTVVGSGTGSLVVRASGFSLGNASASGTATLNLSAVPSFVYSGSTSTFFVGGTGGDTNDEYGNLILAPSNSITAATINISGAKSISNSFFATGNMALGQANVLNVNSLQLGGNQSTDTVQFQSGLTNPTLSIHGVTSGTSRTGFTVGNGESSNYEPDTSAFDLVTGINGTSTLTGEVGAMIVGTAGFGGVTNNAKFLMGGGTLDATSIDVAVRPTGSSSALTQNGLFSVNGGNVLVQSFSMGDIVTASGGTVNATVTLDGGALLSVGTLQIGNGATGSQAVRTFNWNSGTIANYNPAYGLGSDAAESGLTISIPTITMAASGTHTFYVDAGQSGTVSSVIGQTGGAAALTKNGGGLLTLSGSDSYSGGTTVSNGTLQLGSAGALGTGGLTANAGVVDLHGISPNAVAYLNGSGGTITNAGASNSLLAVNQIITTTFNGILADGPTATVALTKTGSGTLYLSSSSTYSGGTTLAGGTLIVANTAGSATGSGNVTFTGGTLASGATGAIGGNVLANSGANTITPGGVSSIGTLNIGGYLNLNNNSVLDFDVNGSSFDSLAIAGSLSDSGTATINISNLGNVGSLQTSYTLASFAASPTLSVSAVGVPSGFQLTATANDLILSRIVTGPATWQIANSGSWTNSANWNSGAVPSGVGVMAVVGTATNSSWTITLDSPQTLGTLVFTNSGGNSAAGYTLDAGTAGSLTLDNSGTAAQIVVNVGSHGITAPVYLVGGDLTVSASNSGVLTISGSISPDTTRNLTLTGDGTGELILSGTNNLGGSGAVVTIASGTLVLASNEAVADGTSLIVGDALLFAGIQPAGASGEPVLNAPASLIPVPEPGTLMLAGAVAVILTVARQRQRRRTSGKGNLRNDSLPNHSRTVA